MAVDWTASMQQSYEFYTVDPTTWKDVTIIDNVTSCTIDRDSSQDTLGSASFECTEALDEGYVRVYLIAIQNGSTHRECLGTFLIQTPGTSFDGRSQKVTIDAYTPLIELKEKVPPIGYSILSGENVLESAINIVSENVRAPVVDTTDSSTLSSDFVANLSDTWATFVSDLLAYADYAFYLDELSRVLFAPIQDAASLAAVWVYTDDNSSILYPDIEDERDLYGIPNVVEAVYSLDSGYLYSKVTNSDPNSPISTVNRGREVVYRDSSPSIVLTDGGSVSQSALDDYASELLRSLSCLEYTITYKHGYCPVRVGDCVELNYERAGITMVRAKVTAQSIKCETGCYVEETATYTEQLWR